MGSHIRCEMFKMRPHFRSRLQLELLCCCNIIIIIYKMFIQGAPSAMPFFQGSLFTNLILKIKVTCLDKNYMLKISVERLTYD